MPSPAWLERGTPAGWVQKEGRGFGVPPWGWGAGPCAGATGEEGRKESGCLMYHAPSQLPALSVNPSCALAVGHEFILCDQTQGFAVGDTDSNPVVPCTEPASSQQCGSSAGTLPVRCSCLLALGAGETQGVGACLHLS